MHLRIPRLVYILMPLLILSHVLWFSFLPLGYFATYTLDVGEFGDHNTQKSLFFDRGEAVGAVHNDEGRGSYRILEEPAKLRFYPDITLDFGTSFRVSGDYETNSDLVLAYGKYHYFLNVEEKENFKWLNNINSVQIYGPIEDSKINSIASSREKDYFDLPRMYVLPFSEEATLFSLEKGLANQSLPEELQEGGREAYSIPERNRSGFYFDGRDDFYELIDSYDKFENDSFAVEVVFEPYNLTREGQIIVGHYNWDIFMEGEEVFLRVGRLNNRSGEFLQAKVPLEEKVQKVSFIYEAGERIIFLFDNEIRSIQPLEGKKIYWEYNKGNNLVIGGNSAHSSARFFEGRIDSVKIYDLEESGVYLLRNNNGFIKGQNIYSFRLVPFGDLYLYSLSVEVKNE